MANYWLNTEEFRLLDWGLQILIDNQVGAPDVQNRVAELKENIYNQNQRMSALHPTEEKFPEMTARFQEIIKEMYNTFLIKDSDYSQWNILATGIIGITTRFWDKTARIMNLIGFNIGTGEYTGPKINMVEDERIEQTFLDASVYGIIARIYIEGKWGK